MAIQLMTLSMPRRILISNTKQLKKKKTKNNFNSFDSFISNAID